MLPCGVWFFIPKLCDALAYFYGTYLSFMTLRHLSVIKTFREEKALMERFEAVAPILANIY